MVERIAGLAQLVEHELPKLEVVGSNPMSRSEKRRGFADGEPRGRVAVGEGVGALLLAPSAMGRGLRSAPGRPGLLKLAGPMSL